MLIDLSNEPLETGPKTTIWRTKTNSLVANCSGTEFPDETEEATAARLVACWNACQGIPTEALNAGAISSAIKSLDEINDTLAIPAAEYVPAIGDVFSIIDRVKAGLSLKAK